MTDLKALSDAATQGEWQPIETAPKDGTYVIVHVDWPDAENQIVVANWVDHGLTYSWRPIDGLTINYLNATHWMPLPAPPVHATEGDG